MGDSEEALTARLNDLEKGDFAGIDQLQIHVKINQEGIISPSLNFIRQAGEILRRHGILFQTLIWGQPGHEASNYFKLMDAGVASFATDYPIETNNAIRQYYENR